MDGDQGAWFCPAQAFGIVDAVGGPMVRRAIAVCLLIAALEACAPEATTVVRGEMSWTRGEFPTLSECETGRVLRFGVMASVPYFRFTQRYNEVSGGGKALVVAEVEGVITRSSSSTSGLTIQHPRVLNVAAGTCDKPLPDSALQSGRVEGRR